MFAKRFHLSFWHGNFHIADDEYAVLKYAAQEVILGIRPEDFHDEPVFIEASQNTKVRAHVEVAELLGAEIMVYSQINGQEFVARVDARTDVKAGQTIDLALDMNKAHFFDVNTELRIRSNSEK